MSDIAPLGFSIDTSPLLKAQEAAEAVAQSLKGVGSAAGQAQQATSGMAQGVSSDAQKLNQAAQAAEALAKANKAVSDTAKQAAADQAALANAPKPTTGTPGAVSPVTTLSAPMPVQSKSGGWYADQATADWADGLAAKRAAASAAEQAALQAAAVRSNPAAALGSGVTGTAVVGAVSGASGGSPQGRAGITSGLDETTAAAATATGAVGRAGAAVGMLGVVGAAVGAALGAGLVMVLKAAGEAAIKAADDAELLERRLVSITGSGAAAARAIEGVSEAARQSGSERGDQRALRVGMAGAPLGSSADDMDAFGGTLAQIDQIGGARAADFGVLGGKVASAFKDGRVELAELSGLLEQTPELARRLEDGLGYPIEAIKQMAAEGRLFADDFIAGINRTRDQVKADFGDIERTSESSFTNMGRAAGEFWDTLSEQAGLNRVSSGIADAIAKGFDDAKRGFDTRGGWEYITGRFLPFGLGGSYNDLVQRAADQEESAGGPPATPAGLPIVGARMPGAGGRPGAPRPNGRTHGGYDFAADRGTPILAMADGALVSKGRNGDGDSGGNRMTVRYEDGTTDFMAHLDGFNQVQRPGQQFSAGDVLGYVGNTGVSSGPHLHLRRTDAQGRLLDPTTNQPVDANGRPLPNAPASVVRPSSDPNLVGSVERGQTLLQSGSNVQIRNLDQQIADLENLPESSDRADRLAELQNQRRAAVAARESLSRTPFTRLQDSADDARRGREIGGGGGGDAIGTAAARGFRAFTEAGYTGATEQDFVNIGVTGAVANASGSTDRVSMQAAAEERRAEAAGRSRVEIDRARITQQVEEFRFSNFGTIGADGSNERITEAVNKYREALERLNAAQRATANAQELLNAQTRAGVDSAANAALAAGQRGYAVDLARQQAEEAALVRDGRDPAASRLQFDSRNQSRMAESAAAANDAVSSAARYGAIGSDAFSRRQFERSEAERRAMQEAPGAGGMGAALAQTRAGFAAEDARIAKDRADADTEAMRVAERQLELQGLVGRSRREALAVMERENDLVAQGLLPANASLSEEEERSVRANSERLRLISEQVQRMQEIDAIAANTADAVGGGARSLFADLFDDGKVEAEKFLSVIQGVVSRIGTNIADVLLVRPLERATERFAEQAVDWAQNAIGSMRGGRDGGSAARAPGSAASVGVAAAGEAAKAVAATAAKAAADGRAAVVTAGATGAMATLTKSAMTASAALTAMAAGDSTKNIGATIVKAVAASGGGSPTGMAFGDTFTPGNGMGGVGAAPTLFQMAGGMGLAFEAGPEAVLPLKRGPDGRLGVAGGGGGDGGGVAITVIDQRGAGAPVETKESRGPDGKRMISMLIRDEARSAVREGDMDGPMRDTYGLTRQIARR